MDKDKIPPVRFIISNWILINSISPLVFILYKLLFEKDFRISEISIEDVGFYLAFVFYTTFFSIPSIVIFGALTIILNQIFEREIISRIFLVILIGPIIYFTFKTYIQDGFVIHEIPSVTLVYWLVATGSILLIRMNRETDQM